MKILTPGPIEVPDFVMKAIAKPTIFHRDVEFETFYKQMLRRLQFLFQTESEVCAMIGSGTAGFEALMYSLFRKGEKVIVVSMGKFSKRWADYGRLLGLQVIEIQKKWGENIKKEEIIQVLENEPDIAGILLTHCETSTGVVIDLEEISFEIKSRNPEILVAVDAMSTVGTVSFFMDNWQIDAAVCYKGLMLPTGTVYFAFSPKSLQKLKPTHTSDFWNLYYYKEAAQKGSYPYSPPVQLFYGADAALQYIENQGLAKIWNHTHLLSHYFKKEIIALGGSIFGEFPTDSLTAFSFEGQDLRKMKSFLKEKGIIISGGQDELGGKILRVSHLGIVEIADLSEVISALREYLQH